MQGKNPTIQPILNRIPKPEDLQKLLKALLMGAAQVQQPINLDSGKKFVLKVQPVRSASGLGRSKSANSSPLWSLCEGTKTVWEYNTSDIELIFNLVEEAVYASSSHSGPIGGTSAAALAVLEELNHYAAPQADGLATPQAAGAAPQASYASQEAPQFSAEAAARANRFGKPAQASVPEAIQTDAAGTTTLATTPSSSAAAAAAATTPGSLAAEGGGMQLSGNLSERGVCDLFQSINLAQMTGRLDITSGLESLEVYFEDGAPRRASFRSDSMTGPVRDITGEEVLLEGMTWKNGFFQFNAAMKSTERSPMRRLELLLMEGAALADYSNTLEKAGLTSDAVPARTNKLSEAEFEKSLTAGIPVNMQQQKTIYMAFNGNASLLEITRESNLPKSAWLPLVFNLFSCGLIGLSAKPQTQSSHGEAPQSPLVKEAMQEAFRELLRADTGLMSYPLFMHFMEVEFQRALRLRLPFSLIVISVHKEGSGITEQLSSEDLKLVSEKIREYLEPYDYIAHYQTLDIGILLPHRPSAQARQYAKKIVDDFNRELAEAGNAVRFIWSVGIGCIPEDGIKLGAIVAKAERERNNAKESLMQPMS